MPNLAKGVVAACAAWLVAAGAASAQAPTMPTHPIGPCGVPALSLEQGSAPLPATTALTTAFQSGNWVRFTSVVSRIVSSLATISADCADAPVRAEHVIVAWVGESPIGEPALLTAIVSLGTTESYASRLPGRAGPDGGVYQLFVSDEREDALAAGYLSTPVENPLLAQVPDVADAVLGPLLSLLGKTASSEIRVRKAVPVEPRGGEKAPPPPAGWATLSRVALPHERAKIAVLMKAALAPTGTGITKASGRLLKQLTLIDVRYSDVAKTFAATLDGLVRNGSPGCAANPPSCLDALDAPFASAYKAACGACGPADLKAVRLVDESYRKLLSKVEGDELDAKLDVLNTPPRRYTFGLMAGFSFARTARKPSVKIDDKVYAHDPIDRQLAMVTVNGAFRPYDGGSFRMTPRERHRWFVGAAIAPTFGVGGGYSYLPIRGLGINAGYVVLGTSTPAKGKTIGDRPANEDDPFALGWAGACFLGASYNFK